MQLGSSMQHIILYVQHATNAVQQSIRCEQHIASSAQHMIRVQAIICGKSTLCLNHANYVQHTIYEHHNQCMYEAHSSSAVQYIPVQSTLLWLLPSQKFLCDIDIYMLDVATSLRTLL